MIRFFFNFLICVCHTVCTCMYAMACIFFVPHLTLQATSKQAALAKKLHSVSRLSICMYRYAVPTVFSSASVFVRFPFPRLPPALPFTLALALSLAAHPLPSPVPSRPVLFDSALSRVACVPRSLHITSPSPFVFASQVNQSVSPAVATQ